LTGRRPSWTPTAWSPTTAFLGDLQSITTASSRYRGYREELAANGITLDPALVRLDIRGIESAERCAEQLLSSGARPTALLTGQNLITIGAYRAIKRLGLQREVALVGFDDILLADLLEPAITVIAQDPAAMGRVAAELLFRRLDGDASPSVSEVIPTKLIVRGTGEIAS
jgi:LacI family transcriptional regulator